MGGNNLLQGTLTPEQQAAREECNTTLDEVLGVCRLAEQGEPCVVNSDCCTGVCQGPVGNKVCTDLL